MKTLADTLPYTLNGICAREVARHWLAKNANFRGISRHSQVHYCLERLFDRSIEESRRQNDSNDEFKDRLIFASNLACTLRNNIWSSKDLDLNYTSLDKFSENDRKNYASYIENIWFRHNPKLAYEEGHRSHHHIDFSVADVEHTFTDYLKTNWITDSYIEYAILDALISHEICIYGQEVKLYLDPLSGLLNDYRLTPVGLVR